MVHIVSIYCNINQLNLAVYQELSYLLCNLQNLQTVSMHIHLQE